MTYALEVVNSKGNVVMDDSPQYRFTREGVPASVLTPNSASQRWWGWEVTGDDPLSLYAMDLVGAKYTNNAAYSGSLLPHEYQGRKYMILSDHLGRYIREQFYKFNVIPKLYTLSLTPPPPSSGYGMEVYGESGRIILGTQKVARVTHYQHHQFRGNYLTTIPTTSLLVAYNPFQIYKTKSYQYPGSGSGTFIHGGGGTLIGVTGNYYSVGAFEWEQEMGEGLYDWDINSDYILTGFARP